MTEVPVIDVAPWFGGDKTARDALARQVDAACREWGFLIIKGHGIDPELMQQVKDATYAFFDLPQSEKNRIAAAARASGGRGYYPLVSKSHARTRGVKDAPGDLRESFIAGGAPPAGIDSNAAARFFASNVWPQEPAAFQSVWEAYFAACTGLTGELMRICARALAMPDTYFDDKIDVPTSTLVTQFYPAQDMPPLPGQIRSGAHTDYGTITLLMTEDRPGGLQVMGMDGEWHDLKPVPGAFIVNLGDMMACWTNDRWRSTLHRVVNPPSGAGAAARRLSIVYFHTPNHDALIECIPSCTDAANPPKHAPIHAGDHLLRQLARAESVSAEAS